MPRDQKVSMLAVEFVPDQPGKAACVRNPSGLLGCLLVSAGFLIPVPRTQLQLLSEKCGMIAKGSAFQD